MQNKLIFTYGTLQVGERNHHFIEGQKLICDMAHTIGQGSLYLFFDRPYVNLTEKRYEIMGSLFEISEKCLVELDKLEGHPDWYQRQETEVYSKALGKKIKADIYLINNVPELPYSIISEHGDFREFIKNYQGELSRNYEVIDGKLIKAI